MLQSILFFDKKLRQETRHKMRIPERDVMYIVICLLAYAYPQIATTHKMDHTRDNLIQLYTFELKLDVAEYIQYTDVWITDLCWDPIPSTG